MAKRRVKIKRKHQFENETPPEMVDASEAVTEAEIDDEEDAIDKMLAGDDSEFDELEY